MALHTRVSITAAQAAHAAWQWQCGYPGRHQRRQHPSRGWQVCVPMHVQRMPAWWAAPLHAATPPYHPTCWHHGLVAWRPKLEMPTLGSQSPMSANVAWQRTPLLALACISLPFDRHCQWQQRVAEKRRHGKHQSVTSDMGMQAHHTPLRARKALQSNTCVYVALTMLLFRRKLPRSTRPSRNASLPAFQRQRTRSS